VFGGAVALVLTAIGVVVGVVARSDDATSRPDAVAERGAVVMPFDLDATTHVFDATSTGGVQRVIADRPGDSEQVALIRSHLRHEVERFRAGDFGDPASIHGHEMPGLAVLERSSARLAIAYRDVQAGGEVTYRTDAPDVVAALHDWFGAQLADHAAHAVTGSEGS
jgi:hypothetical protein